MTTLKSKIDQINTNIVNGKANLETAIVNKGGSVSKAGTVATFNELKTAITNLPASGGGYQVGDILLNNKVAVYRDPNDIIYDAYWAYDYLPAIAGGAYFDWKNIFQLSTGEFIAAGATTTLYKILQDGTSSKIGPTADGNKNIFCVDSSDNIYIITGSKYLYKLDKNGNTIWKAASQPYSTPTCIAIAPNGDIWIGQSTSWLAVYNADGSSKRFENTISGTSANIQSITFGSDGMAYIHKNGIIHKIDPSTIVSGTVPTNIWTYTAANTNSTIIADHGSSSIIISSVNTNTLERLGLDGVSKRKTTGTTYGTGIDGSIKRHPDGQKYVLSSNGGYVAIYNNDFTLNDYYYCGFAEQLCVHPDANVDRFVFAGSTTWRGITLMGKQGRKIGYTILS